MVFMSLEENTKISIRRLRRTLITLGESFTVILVKVPKTEAARLPNKTYPNKHEPGY